MSQMIQDFLKGLKDSSYGLLLILLPLAVPSASGTIKGGLIAAGIIVAVLGVLTNTIQKDFGPVDTWGKVLKDFILGFCTSSIPLIQQGANNGTVWTMIGFTCLITSLSVFANVIQQDITANTILAKVAKDFAVLGLGAIVPILTTAITTHQTLVVLMGTIGTALLSVLANVIKTDVPVSTVTIEKQNVPLAKTAMFLIGLLLIGSTASAWEVSSKPFDLGVTSSKLTLTPAVGGETDLILLPTLSAGYGVGPSKTPSYGWSGAYDIVLANVSPTSVAGMANVVPYLGVGGAFYLDLGPWASSGLTQPVLADGGFNVIGPEINGLIPGVDDVVFSYQHTWNFQTGVQKDVIDLTAPLGAAPEATIVKLKGL